MKDGCVLPIHELYWFDITVTMLHTVIHYYNNILYEIQTNLHIVKDYYDSDQSLSRYTILRCITLTATRKLIHVVLATTWLIQLILLWLFWIIFTGLYSLPVVWYSIILRSIPRFSADGRRCWLVISCHLQSIMINNTTFS